MIRVKHSGDFKKTQSFLARTKRARIIDLLHTHGRAGVQALSSATPFDSGGTANAWSYEVSKNRSGYQLVWNNSNTVDGVNIAVILQYGHGTRNGGYVEGRDYINPTIRPIFDTIAETAWKEVTR